MKNRNRRHDSVTAFSFITPSALLLLVFVIVPIIMTFYLSLTNFNGVAKQDFIGLRNYMKLLRDKTMLIALKNTIRFVLVTVPIQTALSLGIAALLAANLRNRFGEFTRGTLFIPVLCSAALIGSIFVFIFAPDAESLANSIVGVFGVSKVNWLGSPKVAPWVIMGINVWKYVGYFIMIFYAGIMDIPANLYEAAQIDGAGKLKQFIHITIPNLKTILFMVITVGTIWAFQLFDLAYVMTGGGPAYSTLALVQYIYTKGFREYKLGYGSAVSVILFVLVVIVNMIQNAIMKEDN